MRTAPARINTRSRNGQQDTAPAVGLLLTYRQLTELLSVSRDTVDRMIARGELPPPIHVSIGTRRWRRETIMAWIKAKEAEARKRRA